MMIFLTVGLLAFIFLISIPREPSKPSEPSRVESPRPRIFNEGFEKPLGVGEFGELFDPDRPNAGPDELIFFARSLKGLKSLELETSAKGKAHLVGTGEVWAAHPGYRVQIVRVYPDCYEFDWLVPDSSDRERGWTSRRSIRRLRK